MGKVVGILTGGGDAPGLNAVIRSVVTRGEKIYNFEFLGILDGWKGMLEKLATKLVADDLHEIISSGGTIIGTSRTNPLKIDGGIERIFSNFKELGLYALVAVGGDDTLGVADKLYKMGLNVVGVPKTIDNDLSGTDYTFGFDTAVNIVTEAIDRLRTTTKSHHRVMVVEIMGRDAGWITLYGGLAGGADIVIVPEVPFSLDEVCEKIKLYMSKRGYVIVAVAEGAMLKSEKGVEELVLQSEERDAFGNVRLGGIGKVLSKEIQKRTGIETREVILGHLQRGGAPSGFDRVLGTRFGCKAIDLVAEGKFGYGVSLRGTEIVSVPLEDMTKEKKLVPKHMINEIEGII